MTGYLPYLLALGCALLVVRSAADSGTVCAACWQGQYAGWDWLHCWVYWPR